MLKTTSLAIAVTLAANAQRIETEKPDRHKVLRVGTAPNHLSIIELADPVTEVAAGSSSFKIEWRGNKVFVQPLDPEATTNLFIWTASERLSYELVPAHSVEEMDFAIDQEPSPKPAQTPPAVNPAEDPRAQQEAKLATDMLFTSTPVRLAGQPRNQDRVQILLKDIYRDKDRVYVRYAIQNNGRSAYIPATPGVFSLSSPRASSSLYSLSTAQLVGDAIRVTSRGQSPIKVVSAETRETAVAPGTTAWGLVAFELPPRTDGPAVVKFAFPSDGAGEVSALLVL
jgi:hypothetical protein